MTLEADKVELRPNVDPCLTNRAELGKYEMSSNDKGFLSQKPSGLLNITPPLRSDFTFATLGAKNSK